MISQLEFDPGEYHLRVMIERMERDGRSEHAIEDAVRTASDSSVAADPPSTVNRASAAAARAVTRWPHRVRPAGAERRR